ncbi:hypothetical protein KXD40_004510 [Peronospora effusa]|uniref:Uncharacterized protein n=1 Tax=Peronospora effusa TaxID=542832 RepID=A0A3M6VSK5_9STRA|nr:hypothetical protein DD238_005290 [Peronospora effusa]RQM18649.1 hypothetical protein DD237_001539 [Peronospora effusa]UIZ28237.1 hypothetical protein KXD40_004510 [Peronospora effusa]CAI5722254.1 unnamed protein product [Peronospora effusa]
MEDIRRAIREGRILAAKGLYEHAKTLWKTTLSASYSMQDYAGMFVMSVNIGEACIWIATQSNTTSQALSQLQEANENLEYALQLVEKCFLWNSLAGNRALYHGVQRAKTLRRKALDKWQEIEGKQKTIQNKLVHVCTTCGVGNGNILLDENDGCYYCRKCYEEYYATVRKEASIETAKEVLAVQTVDGLEEEEKNGLIAELCLNEKKEDDSAALVVSESTAPVRPVENMCVQSESKQAEENDKENTEKAMPNRTRSERVELGSLADVLAGTLMVGDTVEQPQIQHNDIQNDRLVLVAEDPAEEEECTEKSIATTGDLQEVLNDASSATSSKGVPCEDEIWLLNEDTADKAREKCQYSIAQLLEFRKLSSCDCPEPLMASPVRDDGCTPTRTKVNNSRKKMNPKKSMRSAASYQHNNTNVVAASQAKVPVEFGATRSVSPLPTMDLCNTLRMAFQEEWQKDGDTLRWPLG